MNNIITHAVTITTFGYEHDAPPAAHITLDLREHFHDPHFNPALRELTARDPRIQAVVLGTAGIKRLIDATAAAALAYLSGPSAGPLTVAIGCAGGRHRAATVGMELAALLYRWAVTATLVHRDIDKDVVDRIQHVTQQIIDGYDEIDFDAHAVATELVERHGFRDLDGWLRSLPPGQFEYWSVISKHTNWAYAANSDAGTREFNTAD